MIMEVSSPPEEARTIFSGALGMGMCTPGGEAAHAATQQPYEYSFLNVQTVFRLIKDHGVQRVDDLVGNLLAALRGQAGHEPRMRLGELRGRRVHVAGAENSG